MKKESRRKRNARWIRIKNLMRKYPQCNYGDFYCNHVYDPQHPWVWVDFTFFHTQQRRYFSVAMITAEYEGFEAAESRAIDEAYAQIPDTEEDIFVPAEFDPVYGQLYEIKFTEAFQKRHRLIKELHEKYCQCEHTTYPSIEIRDYGDVAVGVYATVNTGYIDEHVIREFIKHFRSLGEPTNPGWKWKGEEIKVEPRKLWRPN